MSNTDQKLKQLIALVEQLRAPGGCDWDQKQTSETLIPYLLEESHEVVEAILDNEPNLLKEELGDLLLNVVFQVVLANEKKELVKNKKQINENIIINEFKVMDARSRERFEGKIPEPRQGIRSGSIKNSFCLPFSELINEDHTFVAKEKILEKFKLTTYEANILVSDIETSRYFEEVIKNSDFNCAP